MLLVAIAAAVARPAAAQDAPPRPRLDDLERRAAEQAREIDRLRTERMAEELRRAPDAPPHIERSPDGSVAPPAPAFDWGYSDGFFVKGALAGTSYLLRPRAYVQLDS